MNPQQEQLDPSIIALTKAIGHQESAGKYDLVGDNGHSKGAYQWNNPTPLKEGEVPANFKGFAKDVGANSDDFSPENQDRVAYKTVEKWGKQGLTPAQIASKWNSGSPDTYKTAKPGYNAAQGVKYDVKSYVDNVSKYYDQYNQPQQQGGFNPNPYSNPTGKKTTPGQFDITGDVTKNEVKPEEDTLGNELINRGKDITTGISDTMSGKQNIVSGLLQTVGGVAGGIGDVVNKGLELIPGVKQVENLIGQGLGSLTKTPTGQAVMKSISDFSTAHPELSKDIGAGFNIVTAIPILKGLGVVKNVAMDATASALKGYAEKAMAKDLGEIASRTIGGKKALLSNPNIIKTMIDERAIPEIVNGRMSTKEASHKLGEMIRNIDDNELQPLLDSAKSATGIQTSFTSLDSIKNNAIKLAQGELKDTGPIENYFERLKIKYGEYPPIDELNKAKRIVSKNITEAGFASPTYSTDKIVRSSLQQAVEDGGKALGIPNIAEINAKMADLIKTQNFLKYIENKPVKSGVVSGVIKNTATVGGEALGNMTGIPFAGALTGRSVGGSIGKKLTGGIEGILKRTGKNTERVSKEELKKKLGGLFGGAVSQKMSSQ